MLFETIPSGAGKKIAVAILNSEKTLNSLSQAMVDLLSPQLKQWESDATIAAVILRGTGEKAFCAGGDVKELYRSAVEKDNAAAKFYETEYRLDYQIHTYAKPIVCWGTGIVMGGGLGLASGASHRVVTETSRIAMPEISIGLFPDVGGTWFLNRAPGKTGLFLGLTGASINAADALFIGLADRFITSDKYAALLAALGAVQWSTAAEKHAGQVSHVLRDLEKDSKAQLPASPVREHFDLINELCDGDDIEDVVNNIIGWQGEDKWLNKAQKTLAAGCPTTVHLIEKQFSRGRFLSLADIFRMELAMAIGCATYGNFQEGVRALLIDKDNQPKYNPATIAEVTPEFVEKHFTGPWGDGPHPLSDLK